MTGDRFVVHVRALKLDGTVWSNTSVRFRVIQSYFSRTYLQLHLLSKGIGNIFYVLIVFFEQSFATSF